jgi:hypothetical protein
MRVASWEQLMEVIDINGDGKVTIEEMERQAVIIQTSLFSHNMTSVLFSISQSSISLKRILCHTDN